MADFNGALICWIQKQYFQAVAMKYFDWEKLNIVKNGTEQKAILNATVLHPLSQKYPPSNAYKLSFLKSLLAVYEYHGWDVCDELYSLIAELMIKKKSQDDFNYKSYILPCGRAVTLCESAQFVSQGTTGLNTWQAGLYLSNWLIQNKSVVQGKKILELGCGVGLTGLVALHCCRPKSYIFTDCHGKVLCKVKENLQINGFSSTNSTSEQDNCLGISVKEIIHNIDKELRSSLNQNDERNGCFEESSEEFRSSFCSDGLEECETCSTCEHRCEGSVVNKETCGATVCQLDWERCTIDEIERYSPDVILASDVVFDPQLIEPLVNVTKALLSHSGQQPVAYIASTIRNKDTYGKFLLTLDQAGIRKNKIPPAPKNLILNDTSSKIDLLRLET